MTLGKLDSHIEKKETWPLPYIMLFSKENHQESHEKSSISLIMREMQIKTTMSCHLIPVRMAITKKIRKNKC